MVTPNLAIVAGTGALPRELAQQCQSDGRGYQVVVFDGIDLDWVGDHPIISAKYEKPNALFKALKKADCSEVVFAGAMVRPQLNPLKFDLKLMKLAPKLLPALKSGDDTALSMIAKIFEAEGLTIVPAHSILDGLLANGGTWTTSKPNDQDKRDIDRAFSILDAMAVADVGQACVVGQGICLGMESIQGSDVLLKFVEDTKIAFLDAAQDGAGVFTKAPKSGQDERMDMPTIGLGTVQAAIDAKLAGIAIQSGGVQVLDKENCIALADKHGLFITAVDR